MSFTKDGEITCAMASDGIYTLIRTSLIDENHLGKPNVAHCKTTGTITLQEKRMTCNRLEARLRSRCCGFVEVQRSPAHITWGTRTAVSADMRATAARAQTVWSILQSSLCIAVCSSFSTTPVSGT